MPIPDSPLLTSQQKNLLKNLWEKLTPEEQAEFTELLKNQEKNLKDILMEICQNHPDFLKNFKKVRQTRKKTIFKAAETQQKTTDESALETLIDKL